MALFMSVSRWLGEGPSVALAAPHPLSDEAFLDAAARPRCFLRNRVNSIQFLPDLHHVGRWRRVRHENAAGLFRERDHREHEIGTVAETDGFVESDRGCVGGMGGQMGQMTACLNEITHRSQLISIYVNAYKSERKPLVNKKPANGRLERDAIEIAYFL
jgi:hypothetical protein